MRLKEGFTSVLPLAVSKGTEFVHKRQLGDGRDDKAHKVDGKCGLVKWQQVSLLVESSRVKRVSSEDKPTRNGDSVNIDPVRG